MKKRINRVLSLLQSHGPATAYAYMERQGLDTFPPTLVVTIRESVVLVLQHRQQRRQAA